MVEVNYMGMTACDWAIYTKENSEERTRILVKVTQGFPRFNVKAWKENNAYLIPQLIIGQEMCFLDLSRPVEINYLGIV